MGHQYFLLAAEIWSAYFAGRVSLRARDGALMDLRKEWAGYLSSRED